MKLKLQMFGYKIANELRKLRPCPQKIYENQTCLLYMCNKMYSCTDAYLFRDPNTEIWLLEYFPVENWRRIFRIL